jgi:hypothetical protein
LTDVIAYGSASIRFADRFAAALSFVDKPPLMSLAMKNSSIEAHRWGTPS